jgi:uncharacterized ParB-like nuclease family protein
VERILNLLRRIAEFAEELSSKGRFKALLRIVRSSDTDDAIEEFRRDLADLRDDFVFVLGVMALPAPDALVAARDEEADMNTLKEEIMAPSPSVEEELLEAGVSREAALAVVTQRLRLAEAKSRRASAAVDFKSGEDMASGTAAAAPSGASDIAREQVQPPIDTLNDDKFGRVARSGAHRGHAASSACKGEVSSRERRRVQARRRYGLRHRRRRSFWHLRHSSRASAATHRHPER